MRLPAVANGPTGSVALPELSVACLSSVLPRYARTLPVACRVEPTVTLIVDRPEPARIDEGLIVAATVETTDGGIARSRSTKTGLWSDEANGDAGSTRLVT